MSGAASESSRLFEEARAVLAAGSSRVLATTPGAAGQPGHVIYARSAEGARVVDVDGNEFIDFNNNNTALIHGHAHPEIVRAVQEQAAHGSAFSFGTEAEVRLAQLLCERVPGFERVRFSNSGTEAAMMAIRVARAYTGRPKIAKCEGSYHGTYDYSEISFLPGPDVWGEPDPRPVPSAAGTPQGVLDDVVVIPFNDTVAAQRILEEHADELAAVIFDPLSYWVGMVPPTPDFLAMLRAFTKRAGVLLIFDEVVAFRLGYHGAQGVYDAQPDLTCMAKIIGGGFPVGAIAGSAEIMGVLEGNFFAGGAGRPRLSHGGTFNANVMTMTAGLVAMQLWTEDEVARLNQLGERARAQLREAFRAAAYPGQVTGVGSFFRVHLTERPITGYRSQYWSPDERAWITQLQGYLLRRGIFTQPMMSCLSTAMTQADIDQLAEAFEDGLRMLVAEGKVPA